MKYPLLSIIIPARREERSIARVLGEIDTKVKTPHEVIVVIDKDREDTTDVIARRYAKAHRNVTVIARQKTAASGFARALRDGFAKAKGAYIIPVMGDGCDDAATIDRMVRVARSGWDVVVGSRYRKEAKKQGGPFIQSILSKLTCAGIRLLTGIPTTDVSNSFKLYRKTLLRSMSINATYGTEVSMDITLRAYFSGARITDVPTIWNGGNTRGSELEIFRRTAAYARVCRYALVKSFERRPLLFAAGALAIGVTLAYWQTVGLYFWGDDWDVLFKVIHPQDRELWHLGPGIFGKGSYRYLHTPFVFLFPFFGLNAGPYWAVGMGLYFVAAISVYLLVDELVGKHRLALAIALLFGVSGYIGSYTTFHLSNLYQMLFAVIGICWTLWLLYRHIETNKPVYYLASLALFWASIELVFLRTSGILLLVIGLMLLYWKRREPFPFVLRLLPFFVIFIMMYAATPVAGQSGSATIAQFFRAVFAPGQWKYLFYPFGTLGNVIVPDIVAGGQHWVVIAIGLFATGASLYLFIRSRERHEAVASLGMFGFVWFFAQYLGYYLVAPRDGLLETAHRYLTPSLPGAAMAVGAVGALVFQRSRRLLAASLAVLMAYLVIMINTETYHTIQRISNPTRGLYRQVRAEIPALSEHSIVYFQLFFDPPLIWRYRSNYPRSALAVFYGLKVHATVVDTWEDLTREYQLTRDIDEVYSFYVTEDEVINRTDDVRKKLTML